MIRRPSGEYVIVKRSDDPGAAWEFPGVRVEPRAASDDALRRHCLTALGLELDTLIPQPSFDYSFGTHRVSYRYFLCTLPADEACPIDYAALRWVPWEQLREYELDAGGRLMAARLTDGASG